MKDFLSSKERVQEVIKMFQSQVATLEEEKQKRQQEIQQIEDKLGGIKDSLTTLEQYYELIDLVGFSAIKQTIEAHAEEMKHAREERIKEQQNDETIQEEPNFRDEGFHFTFN